ncbi:MAG: AAA family ATPase [Bacteroidaceae bacterium]|nr:AAA family ATPase [Bacteroidaceae bacterium]
MASYINLGNESFASSRLNEYVDKTGMIAVINGTLFTRNRFTCVSRCRRFGKSMAAEMLCAYYDKSCDSRELFRGLEIENNPDFEKHLNKYPVIYVDMTDFMTRYRDRRDVVEIIQQTLIKDISTVYGDVGVEDDDDLMAYLLRIAERTGDRFVIIIDEWDAICREYADATGTMNAYVDFLRRMFKGEKALRVFACAYLTGILPIKKYKTESALNNFWEYSMIDPEPLSRYFGFTREEVRTLCAQHDMPYEELEKWYDGYSIGTEPSMFNPSSVVKALAKKSCFNYWATTGAFDAVARYIQMDYEGLQGNITSMLAGGRCKVETTSFGNDPAIIRDRDEVLTILIHLGYLAYDAANHECYIPNMEVGEEMKSAIKANNWTNVIETLNDSDRLLEDLLYGDAEAVAEGVEAAHERNASILKYNDENALSCVINLAFYTARNKYKIIRELPAGRGFADVVFIPWHNVNLPAIVIELKWKQTAQTALDQIRERHYPESLKDYTGEVVLCGINYDKETKVHTCLIERL